MAAVVAAVAAAIVFSSSNSDPKPPLQPNSAEDSKNPGAKAGKLPQMDAPANVYIGRGQGRIVHTIFTTRKKEVLYQALVRYEPVTVGWNELPGLSDIQQVYARQGVDLPPTIRRIDQETEMTTVNLGEPLRFVTGIKYYLNPANGKVIAYDMAQTTGGQPQRMVGHLSKNGMAIEVYRGGQLADRQEVTFVRDTLIPVEYEFIHQWYEQPENDKAKAAREQIKFSIFVPEAMAQVLLVVKPLDDETIPVGDATYRCAHYEALTVSTQSAEGIYARQEMWFDRASGRMMRRQDYDASLKPGDAPVTDREPYQRIDKLGNLTELPVLPPQVDFKSADYLLERDLSYTMTAGDKPLGRLNARFSKFEAGKSEPPFVPVGAAPKPEYFSVAQVQVNTGGSLRNETAVTLYDALWKPLNYEARGEEKTSAKLDYRVSARMGAGKIHVYSHREIVPELRVSAVYTGALAGFELGTRPSAALGDENFQPPLKPVPIGDDEAAAQESDSAPRLADQYWTRAFPEGTFVSDFNRVEHLSLLALRLPQPPVQEEGKPVVAAFQKAALYLVRQNRCGVMLFDIRPESKPKLTERQKRRMTNEELNEPTLYLAHVTAAMMPCKMLLAPDGRILELTMKYGSGDVTYTLDDPIMKRRAERARAQKLQEGPRLVRPPWW